MHKKIIAILLVVVCFATSIIPAEAEIVGENITADIFTADTYYIYKNGVKVGSADDPYQHMSGVTSCGYQWEVDTDYYFKYCYFTVMSLSKPNSMQVQYYVDGPWSTAELVGNYDNIYQYRVACNSLSSYIQIRANYSAYTGYFGLLSFVGFRDISNNITKVDVTHRAWRAYYDDTSVLGYYSQAYTYGTDTVSIPYTKHSTFTPSTYEWLYSEIYFDIKPSYRKFDLATNVGFVLALGDLARDFSIQLIDSSGTIKHVITPNVSASFSFNALLINDYAWPVTYHEVVADLSGYDLDDLTIRLEFQMDPVQASNTQEFMYYEIVDCYLNPYIEDVPWYKTFWGWLSTKWDSVTSTIKNAINSGVDKIVSNLAGGVQNAINAEKDAAQEMGNSAIDGATGAIDEAIPNNSDGFISAVTSLTNSMSYNGTEAVLVIPAIHFPTLPGLIDGFVLLEEQKVDLGWWFQQLPNSIITLVQVLCTISLIVYCFKELYGLVSYAMTLKGGGSE